jgi:hypothetical protein
VDTGSREENALFPEARRVFPIRWVGKRYAAFSSEADTGSREENALFPEARRVFPILWIGKRYSRE